jgi:transcriptional regulator with GAF, ATPase, and Fis domain
VQSVVVGQRSERGDDVVEQAALLARLTRSAAAQPAKGSLTERLCRALAEITGMDGCSLSIGSSPSGRSMLCSTDAVGARIEDIQDMVREGPSIDAWRLQRASAAHGADLADRWPLLARELTETTATTLLALPMMPGPDVLGVLTLHGATQLPTALDLDELQFLADAIGTAVIGSIERSDEKQEIWSTRDAISQATGMVIAQLRVEPADALAVLRAHAFAHGLSLLEIANQVLDRTVDFKPDPTRTNEGDDRA